MLLLLPVSYSHMPPPPLTAIGDRALLTAGTQIRFGPCA